MFACVRFLIGLTVGALLVVGFPYPMEFINESRRAIVGASPDWAAGVGIFAMSSYLRPDWSHQHIIVACLHVPFLFGWFFVPESLRFLTIKGRLDEAEAVVEQMAKYNRTKKPEKTREILQAIANKEKKQAESGSKYTYIDVYRGFDMCWRSLSIQLLWACLSFVYYGISFGIGNLSGNLYLNIFLLGVIEIPFGASTFFLNNKIGRRWTSFMFFVIATACAFGVVIVSNTVTGESSGTTITVLALASKVTVGSGWSAVMVFTSEAYPTGIRNLGYGAANTAARVGGILSPYIFAMDKDNLTVPFVIVGSTMATSAIISLFMRETNKQPLADTKDKATKGYKYEYDNGIATISDESFYKTKL